MTEGQIRLESKREFTTLPRLPSTVCPHDTSKHTHKCSPGPALLIVLRHTRRWWSCPGSPPDPRDTHRTLHKRTCCGCASHIPHSVGRQCLSGKRAAAYAQGGYQAVLHWQIRALESKAVKQYVSPVTLADFYAQLGERDKTIALLEEAYPQHSPLLLDIQNEANFDFLHKDERYRSLIRRIGLQSGW